MTGYRGLRHPPRRKDVIVALMKVLWQPSTHLGKGLKGIACKNREIWTPWVLELPTTAEGIELEIRGDSKTMVAWINGHAKQKTAVGPWRPSRNK